MLNTTEITTIEERFLVRAPELSDVPAVVELINAVAAPYLDGPDVDEPEMRADWSSPDLNLATDARVIFDEDTMVAHITLWKHETGGVRVYSWGHVHPDYVGQGLGSYLLAFAEASAREVIPLAPKGARVTLQNGIHSTNERGRALFESQGYELARHFWRMVVELPEKPPAPRWPDGITVRAMGPDDLPAVVRATDEAFRDHYGHVERPFDEQLKQWRHWTSNDPHHNPALWFLAMDGDKIAGVSLTRDYHAEDPDLGWVNTLGVRRPWRRQGLALALLRHSFNELYARGCRRVGLGVDASSLTGATALYEKAGMRVTRQYDSFQLELRPGREISTQSVP